MKVTFFWAARSLVCEIKKILGKEELSMTQAIGSCSKNPLAALRARASVGQPGNFGI